MILIVIVVYLTTAPRNASSDANPPIKLNFDFARRPEDPADVQLFLNVIVEHASRVPAIEVTLKFNND
jgi:hypothetical protein